MLLRDVIAAAGHFVPLSAQQLIQCSVVVTTCMSAGGQRAPRWVTRRRARDAGTIYALFPPNDTSIERHFNSIFIDEAGHATEARALARAALPADQPNVQPEILTALGGLSSPYTRVVIAGDPQQLGPIVRSAVGEQPPSIDVQHSLRRVHGRGAVSHAR
jgi:hypothetical protein